MKTGKQQVDAYIVAAPIKARPMLRALRRLIKTCAPKVEERISYKIPFYEYHGRLTYFAAFKHHVSLYVMGRAKKMFAKEIKPYQTSLATLRFPIGTPVPATLVKKIIRERVKENDAARRA